MVLTLFYDFAVIDYLLFAVSEINDKETILLPLFQSVGRNEEVRFKYF